MDKVGRAFAKAEKKRVAVAVFLRNVAFLFERQENGYSFDDLRCDLKYALEWVDNDLDAPAQTCTDWPDFDGTDGATWTMANPIVCLEVV